VSSAVKTLEGFKYVPELIDVKEEEALVARVRKLPFQHFDFHGYKGKRRVVWFGWRYDYSERGLEKADAIPDYLLDLRVRVGAFAEMDPAKLHQVLVTEYEPGAGIGWHRDKAEFGQVAGVSLLSACVLRFRREIKSELFRDERRRRQWERININAERRSAYLLTGAARLEWQHSIASVDSLRYSITFRNVLNPVIV
jgi:alkylated DNA repair dioxygenase AlkB